MSPAVIGGLALVAVLVAGFVVFLVSGRRAEDRERVAAERAAQNLGVALDRPQHIGPPQRIQRDPIPRVPPGANWKKVLGTWSRTPKDEDDGDVYRFEFRADMTVAMTHTNLDGRPFTETGTAEVLIDQDDLLMLEVDETQYDFVFKPDGTIALGTLVYTRVK